MTSHKNRAKTAKDPLQREKNIEQLADLLAKAAPLVELLNSSDATHEDRAQLRELVGPTEYDSLTTILCQACSLRAKERMRPKDMAIQRRLYRLRIRA
jgi:hypothetical protein